MIGGGLVQQVLPNTLADEGLLMLEALVTELVTLSSVQITVLLDYRIKKNNLPDYINVIRVCKGQCVFQLLPALIDDSDYVWPIAPEMDGALLKITQLIENSSKHLLNSSSKAIAICSDKLLTCQALEKNGIATVDSVQLNNFLQYTTETWAIKRKDGVGCINSHFISNKKTFIQIKNQIENPADYIIQPFVAGDSLSLSCLFKQGKAWLLCCNQQLVSIKDDAFELEACVVNISPRKLKTYQNLINNIANVIPGLFGYVGIDIIQPEEGFALVLEINPRLTTSYVGINQAIGFNVAKAVIEMLKIDPIIKKTRNEQITVSIVDI